MTKELSARSDAMMKGRIYAPDIQAHIFPFAGRPATHIP
jgi:hypothetical protein